jgi:hypothetical protein
MVGEAGAAPDDRAKESPADSSSTGESCGGNVVVVVVVVVDGPVEGAAGGSSSCWSIRSLRNRARVRSNEKT